MGGSHHPEPLGAGGKKPLESRFSRARDKDDKGSGSSKSAPPKGKETKSEENKDEKIVEEENQERRFDGSGYDKDLVDMLGKVELVCLSPICERLKETVLDC